MDSQSGATKSDVTLRRWRQALRRAALVEWHSPLLPRATGRTSLHYAGRTAWTARPEAELLPPGIRPQHDKAPTLTASVTADAVAVGKFDVTREVRFRSFYMAQGLTVRFQAGGQRNGVNRTVLAHQTVSEHDRWLMPQLEDYGQASPSQGMYLVERP